MMNWQKINNAKTGNLIADGELAKITIQNYYSNALQPELINSTDKGPDFLKSKEKFVDDAISAIRKSEQICYAK